MITNDYRILASKSHLDNRRSLNRPELMPGGTENRSTILQSIVTQTYESDPITHIITATHPRETNDVYNELLAYIENNEDMDFIDYVAQANQINETLIKDAEFICSTDFGGSEGTYIDIRYQNDVYKKPFATIKTLDDTAEGFMKMSRIAATLQLLLNGNGRTYEMTQEHALSAQRPTPAPAVDHSHKTIYVCSPLAGEIESNIRKAREYSKFVARQGSTPIAPHITELFDDAIPEEREMGLTMGLEYLRKADELWVFGNRVSEGMAAEIKMAQNELHIPVFHVDALSFEVKSYGDFLQKPGSTIITSNILLQEALQPLLDEIKEYETVFDIQSKFHPEESSKGRAEQCLSFIEKDIQSHKLATYDKPFDPSQVVAKYSVYVHNPYYNTFENIGYSTDKPHYFSVDKYKAFQQLHEVLQQKETTKQRPLQNAVDSRLVNSLNAKLHTAGEKAQEQNSDKASPIKPGRER